jgi:hypothetical protein
MSVVVGFSRMFLPGILIFKGLTALRLYKSFGVKGLIAECDRCIGASVHKCVSNCVFFCVVLRKATMSPIQQVIKTIIQKYKNGLSFVRSVYSTNGILINRNLTVTVNRLINGIHKF